MPRKASTPASTTNYRHDATRLNNPPAGLADVAPLPPAGRTRYAYDQHLDPQLVWAGKAKHLTFDVETMPLHIHERIAPAALIDALRDGRRPAGCLRGNHTLVRSAAEQDTIPPNLVTPSAEAIINPSRTLSRGRTENRHADCETHPVPR